MSDAREEILGRIRAALGPAGAAAPTGPSTPAAPSDRPPPAGPQTDAQRADDGVELVGHFAERVADYRATVQVVDAGGVADAVAAACARNGVGRLAVPDGFDAALVPAAVEQVPARPGSRDDALRFADVDGLVAQAPLAIAETGTLVFDAGPGQGPRAASLLPDLLIAVVSADAIVPGVPEATAWMADGVREHGRPLTLVSGPSATSDIELNRVEGVHGPRTLEVVIVR